MPAVSLPSQRHHFPSGGITSGPTASFPFRRYHFRSNGIIPFRRYHFQPNGIAPFRRYHFRPNSIIPIPAVSLPFQKTSATAAVWNGSDTRTDWMACRRRFHSNSICTIPAASLPYQRCHFRPNGTIPIPVVSLPTRRHHSPPAVSLPSQKRLRPPRFGTEATLGRTGWLVSVTFIPTTSAPFQVWKGNAAENPVSVAFIPSLGRKHRACDEDNPAAGRRDCLILRSGTGLHGWALALSDSVV